MIIRKSGWQIFNLKSYCLRKSQVHSDRAFAPRDEIGVCSEQREQQERRGDMGQTAPGRETHSPPEPALLAQSPGAAWKLRRTELVPCPSIGSTFTSSQPTVRPLSSVKCRLSVSQESFHILLLDFLLGTVPHLTAQDTHKHHLAPLAAPRLQSRRLVLDRWWWRRLGHLAEWCWWLLKGKCSIRKKQDYLEPMRNHPLSQGSRGMH